jgi:hypothetical protein
MASMRRVTKNPPKILIAAIKTDKAAKIITRNDPDPICIKAPNIIMEEIAFVTAIKGVCKEWLTFQIT